jgi:hypothetical protein
MLRPSIFPTTLTLLNPIPDKTVGVSLKQFPLHPKIAPDADKDEVKKN